MATQNSDIYVVYFYRSDNSSGTLKNMCDGSTYTAKWYNPTTGIYTTISTSITSTSGQWTIPSRPDSNDWLLLVTNNNPGGICQCGTGEYSRWRLDQNAIDDHSVNNGSVIGSAVFSTTDKMEGTAAVSLDGINDYVSIPDNASFDNLGQLTVSFWMKMNSLPSPSYASPVSKEAAYRFVIDSGGASHFVVATQNNAWYSSGTQVNSTMTLSPGTWYHIVCVYDGQHLYIYTNGVLTSAHTATNLSGTTKNSTSVFAFGKSISPNISYFNGLMDDVRFFQYAFTQTDVNCLYGIYTGTPDADNNFALIAPNPSAGFFFIRSDVTISSVEITNVLGAKIFSLLKPVSDHLNVDLTAQPKGIYIYKIVAEDKRISTGKILIL